MNNMENFEAYKEQIKEYKYTAVAQYDWIIDALYSKYSLNIDKKVIENDIRSLNG